MITDLHGVKCFVKDCFIHIAIHIQTTIFDVLGAYDKFIWSLGISKNLIIMTQSNIFVNMKLGRNQIANQLLTLWVQIKKKFHHLKVFSPDRAPLWSSTVPPRYVTRTQRTPFENICISFALVTVVGFLFRSAGHILWASNVVLNGLSIDFQVAGAIVAVVKATRTAMKLCILS